MVNGIGSPNPDLSRLAGILARPGIGRDAGDAGLSGGEKALFSLPAENADTENPGASGMPRPADLANDGGNALLRGMSEDFTARARFIGTSPDAPLPVLSESRLEPMENARRTYAAVSAPAREAATDIGDSHAAALFQPIPQERRTPAVPAKPVKSRFPAVLIPVLAAFVLVLLLIYIFSR